MTDSEPDVTEKLVRTDSGYRLTIESTRGTGTRDEDTVKAELRRRRIPTVQTQREMVSDVKDRMTALREHQPDDEDGGGDD